jgi:hypothetical protein
MFELKNVQILKKIKNREKEKPKNEFSEKQKP